jgi:mycothiol synthase
MKKTMFDAYQYKNPRAYWVGVTHRGKFMTKNVHIRNYRSGDLPALVALINEADAHDKSDRATTLQELEHEMSFPTARPETDCFLAWEGDRLVGYTDLYVRSGDANLDKESTIYSWGVVHPRWRRRGLGRRLLERSYRRAAEYLPELEVRRLNFQCTARDVEGGRIALYESLGMVQVRYFVNLARPLNGNLPPVGIPAGFRLRTFDPERDAEAVWQVDNTAFRDHWGYSEGDLGDFLHWIELPYIRPELWFLAEEEASGDMVGLGLNVIDPNWITQTGRREGYVSTLAVLREHRKRGLGTALLVQSLHALQDAGMESAHLHADADNLTGAMRLYERVGFRVRKTSMAYQKVLRDG